LPSPDTRIALGDLSPEPVPPGIIQFAVEQLVRPALPDSPALWRGEVLAGSRRINIWARAKISVPVTRLIAVDDLKPGQLIDLHQIRTEIADGFPTAKAISLTAEAAAGMLPLRSISAGTEIRPENLVRPFDVIRGDLVHVEVRMGQARLSMRGRAEAAGRVGDTIAIRNPESNSVFRARIEGKDSVLVDPQRSGGE
jgi:flagella basal body P-ring formation protein FlgA